MIVFARAPDLNVDRIDLFVATTQGGAYDGGTVLSLAVNLSNSDTLGAEIDWSQPSHCCSLRGARKRARVAPMRTGSNIGCTKRKGRDAI